MSTVFQIRRYTPAAAADWDELIGQSVNGGFILKRSFMEYHQDRFEDFSCLIWKKNRLIAVFAAALPRQRANHETLVAHPGLTYGGLITRTNLRYSLLAELYQALFAFLKSQHFTHLLIRPTPDVFCRQPSDSSRFFFHQQAAGLSSRELNSVIDLTLPFRLSSRQKNNLRKARKNDVRVEPSGCYPAFWPILTENLRQVHGVQPVHTLAEIEQLAAGNPDHIELYVARIDDRVLAGVVLFKDRQQGYLHSQYVSANAEGRRVGAVDATLFHLMHMGQRAGFRRFSLGVSTVGGEINHGLLGYKEGFGATAELVDTYLLRL